jgi:type VI secretion system protein ImpL
VAGGIVTAWIFYLLISLAIIAMIIAIALILRARFIAKDLVSNILALLQRRKKVKDFWFDLQQLIADLHTHKAGRYDTPWLMLLGGPDSGRSGISRALALGDKAHPLLKLINRSGNKDAWQILQHGIIIDGQYLGESKKTLKSLLQEINQVRPERPLDGVIITLSAETLLTTGRTRLRTEARYIHSLLWLLQKELGFVLPIYVVITKTDHVSGYREFWRAFPNYQDQIFGWSSPYHLDARFEKDWVTLGMESIVQQLYHLQSSALAGINQDSMNLIEARDFILFPRRLANLQDNLSWALEQIFDDVIFSSGASVRGFYFTGHMDDSSAPIAIKELIEQKCFAEKNIAKPLRVALWSRAHRLQQIQRIVAYGLGALFLSMAYSFFDLKQQMDLQLNAAKTLQIYSSNTKNADNCISTEEYFLLINSISKIHSTVSYWNIPSSWMESKISSRPVETASNALRDVILPAFKCKLEIKAKELLEEKSSSEKPSQIQLETQFFGYAREVLLFEKHKSLFNKITQANAGAESEEVLGDFQKLTQYLYNQQLPGNVISNNGVLQKAMMEEYNIKVNEPDGYDRVVPKNLESYAEDLKASLTTQLQKGEALMNVFTQPDAVTRTEVDDLLAWNRHMGDTWLSATERNNPCITIFIQVDSLAKSLNKYGAKSLDTIAQHFTPDQCYASLKRQLLTLHSAEGDAVMKESPDGLQWSPTYLRNSQQLELLVTKEFMMTHPTTKVACDYPVAINHIAVLQSLKSLKSYQEFVTAATIDSATNSQLQSNDNFINATARSQIKSLINYQMTKAIQPIGFTTTQEQLIEKVSFSYSQSIDELVAITRLYQQLMLDTSDAEWFTCMGKIASEQLNEITSLYKSTSVFLPQLAPPGSEFLYVNMSKAAEVSDFLNAQQLSSARLVQYARPYARWFNEAARFQQESSQASVLFWANSINDYDNFSRFNDNNTKLAQLRDYYTSHFTGVTSESCLQADDGAPPSGNDLFSERAAMAMNDLLSLCGGNTAHKITAEYQYLSDAFNRQIAGHYPFANVGAADLDPQVWVNFSDHFYPLITVLKQNLDRYQGEEHYKPIKKFIDELAAVQTHLNLLYPNGIPASVKIATQFKTDSSSASGTEQIVQWLVRTPSLQSSYPNQVSDIEWISGQSLQVSMSWADLSTFTPTRDPDQQTMSVQGKVATFQQTGPWALHRLIEQQRDSVARDLSVTPLRFTVPVTTKDITPKNDVHQAAEAIQLKRVNALLSLILSIKGETGQWQAWPIPQSFPQRSPGI